MMPLSPSLRPNSWTVITSTFPLPRRNISVSSKSLVLGQEVFVVHERTGPDGEGVLPEGFRGELQVMEALAEGTLNVEDAAEEEDAGQEEEQLSELPPCTCISLHSTYASASNLTSLPAAQPPIQVQLEQASPSGTTHRASSPVSPESPPQPTVASNNQETNQQRKRKSSERRLPRLESGEPVRRSTTTKSGRNSQAFDVRKM